MHLIALFNFSFLYSLVFGKCKEPVEYSVDMSIADQLLSIINGFLITVTCRGNIMSVSTRIEQHLGYCQVSEIYPKKKKCGIYLCLMPTLEPYTIFFFREIERVNIVFIIFLSVITISVPILLLLFPFFLKRNHTSKQINGFSVTYYFTYILSCDVD